MNGARSLLLLFCAALALLACKRRNHPPDTPVVTGPASGFIDSVYTFTATATDPDGDSVSIRFDWGNGDTSAWSALVGSRGTFTLDHSWPDSGAYEVRTQARDDRDLESGWSEAFRVGIGVWVNHPPDTPDTPAGPSTGHVDSLYWFTVIVNDPDGDSVSVRFYWGIGAYSDWSSPVPSGTAVTMSHAWDEPGAFKVHAQAKDVHDSLSLWSGHAVILIGPLRWRYETGGVIYSSPAIGADGTIYTGSDDQCLYALNPDGTLKWRYAVGHYFYMSSPSVGPDGTVYIASSNDMLNALTPNGTMKWQYGAVVYWTTPVIGEDGTVYVGSHAHNLTALNPDGSVKWQFATENGSPYAIAIARDGTIYAGTHDIGGGGHIYAVTPGGALRWQCQTGSGISACGIAIGADGTLYAGSDTLYAIDKDGAVKWRVFVGWARSGPVLGLDGTVYIGSHDGYLYAFDREGTLKWWFETEFIIWGSPAVCSDETVYIGAMDYYLYALNADGTMKWRYLTGFFIASSPAIGPDGTVYVGSGDGYLYAVRGSAPLADSPWPKFHHDNQNTGRAGGP